MSSEINFILVFFFIVLDGNYPVWWLTQMISLFKFFLIKYFGSQTYYAASDPLAMGDHIVEPQQDTQCDVMFHDAGLAQIIWVYCTFFLLRNSITMFGIKLSDVKKKFYLAWMGFC